MRIPVALAAFAFALAPAEARADGAIDAVAQELTRSLGGSTHALVVAATAKSDDPIPRGAELGSRIAATVASRLGTGARAYPQTAPLDVARALAKHASTLVYVQAEIVRGDLRTTIDLYPSTANVWERVRDPVPAPVSRASAVAKIDAGVRAFLAPLSLEQATIERARHDEADVLSAACGDAGGDDDSGPITASTRRGSIVLVSRTRVVLGHVVGRDFVAGAAVAWSALAQRAPVPMREPLGGSIVTRNAVDVGSTDYGGVELTTALARRAPLFGIPAWGGDEVVCLRPEPSAGAFDGAPVDCSAVRDAKPKMSVPAPRFDAFAAAAVADSQGNSRTLVAVREPSGRLRLKVGNTSTLVNGLVGAQLAVGDLDQDGVPDIAAAADGAEDGIDVYSWGGDADPRSRLHVPVPGHVSALAVCPPDLHGAPTLVAVIGGEVWLVRAAGVTGKQAAK